MEKIFAMFMLALSVMVPARGAEPGIYRLKVGDFSELKVLDGLNVDYECSTDSAGYAVFACVPSVASSFIFDRNGSRLTVRLSAENPPAGPLPVIKIYSRYLTKAENKADSTLRVLSPARGPKFEAGVEGNGKVIVRDILANEVTLSMRLGHGMIVASGECDKLKVKFVGTGTVEADDLKASEVSVNSSGTGSVGVWAVGKLSLFGMGSTSVYYKGHPEIKNRSVGLKLLPIAQ